MKKVKINVINDIFYAETKPLIENILENKECPNCKGFVFDGYDCKYCGTENIYVKVFLEKIEDILNNYERETKDLKLNLQNNKFFDLLFCISNLNISIVDDFLDKYNYKSFAMKNYDNILKKIYRNEELLENEIEFLDLLIWMNYEFIDYRVLHVYFFRQAILKRKNVSYKSFKQMIKMFVEDDIFNSYGFNAICEIEPFIKSSIADYASGTATCFTISISEKVVNLLYYKGEIELFYVIGHEMYHIGQFRKFFKNDEIVGFSGILSLEDYILSINSHNYYMENYYNVIFEQEANIIGISLEKNYLSALGFQLNTDIYQSDIEELFARMQDKRRIVNGEETTVDVEFEKFIYNRPEIFLRYPKLARLYKIVGNNVILKSNDELNNDLKEILENPELHEEYKEQIQLFYNEYINGDFKKLKRSKD